MKAEEAFAKKYLEGQGYQRIIYEPDGQTSPDFSICSRIAIEVRRLNYNRVIRGEVRSVEQDAIPLKHSFEHALSSYGPPDTGQSWFVSYECVGEFPPVLKKGSENWEQMHRELRAALDSFLSGDWNGCDLDLSCGLRLSIFPASSPHLSKFLIGMTSDSDTGVLLFPELERNIDICIEDKSETHEKQSKKSNVKFGKYDEWWLLLVDCIGYGFLSRDECKQLLGAIRPRTPWSRIVVVDWRTGRSLVCQ